MTNSKNNNRVRKKSTGKPPKNMKNKKRQFVFDINVLSLIMMALSIFLFIFILSANTGKLGLAISGGFTTAFGKYCLIIPIVIFISFLFAYRDRYLSNIKEFLLLYFFILIMFAYLSKDFVRYDLGWTIDYNKVHASDGGGVVGGFLSFYLVSFIGTLGVKILFWISLFLFVVGISPITYRQFLIKLRDFIILIVNKIKTFTDKKKQKRREKESKKEKSSEKTKTIEDDKINLDQIIGESKKDKKDIFDEDDFDDINIFKPVPMLDLNDDSKNEIDIKDYKSKQIEIKDIDQATKKDFDSYNYPTSNLLTDRSNEGIVDRDEIKNKAKSIEETLESFGILAKVVQIDVGPTVTCYEIKPQRGVKVSRILNLSDDLALSLATSGIRILAPIPGKSHVGIEVPNRSKEVVGFKEIISSADFINSKSEIPFAMGKSIAGDPIVSAIEKMPHLLVSGATGSGKSVCINTIIMSILYKHSPEEVKLLMIDPKVVELSIYNGIPHLIMPVITDPKKASSSLFWAIGEMEKRYKAFQKYHVRDIKGYKEKAKFDESMENLPYIVVIIDELADLMMTAASEVEDYIMRLAQKSRACGIHLVIATQRPTVDVVTGTIKANIPSRISFAVTSQTDSRTILDQAGAEKLLGKGDMLYQSSDSMRPLRIQGAFISDKEVLKVVQYIKEDKEASYNKEAIETVEENSKVKEIDDEDELLDEAIQIIIDENTASVSLLQRKLRIGYARAGRIIDQLEAKGLVGPYEGSKPRKVLVDRSYFEGGKRWI